MIEEGKIYINFDDGKIKESRIELVYIEKILSYHQVKKDMPFLINFFKETCKRCNWMNFHLDNGFIIASNMTLPTCGIPVYVKTDKYWFSFTPFSKVAWDNSGELDEDGSLLKQCVNELNFFEIADKIKKMYGGFPIPSFYTQVFEEYGLDSNYFSLRE